MNKVIINGGMPLGDCPINWDDAYRWEEEANHAKDENMPIWKWDCGFKLDYDGPILSVSSRFYPPKTHYGETWDGEITISILGKEVKVIGVDCNTLDKLKATVESHINGVVEEIINLFKEDRQ